MTSNNERIVIVDRSGLKLADSNKASSDRIESFANLVSFNDAMTSTEEKPGSVVEVVNGTEFYISYYPVNALSSTWVILFMQPPEYLIIDSDNVLSSSFDMLNSNSSITAIPLGVGIPEVVDLPSQLLIVDNEPFYQNSSHK